MAFITQYNFQRIIVNQDTMGKHGLRMDGQDGLLYAPRQIDWFNDLEASRLYLCQILQKLRLCGQRQTLRGRTQLAR